MTKDDIIKLAREAGAAFPSVGIWHRFDSPEELERFATLVAAAEREECAKLLEEYPYWLGTVGKREIVATIRARGNK